MSLNDLLDKLSYRVKVEKVINGCCVLYPKILNKQNMDIHVYSLTKKGFQFTNTEIAIYEYECPNYLVRPMIVAHIWNRCNKIHYDVQHIQYVSGPDIVPDIYDIISIKGTQKDQMNEYLCFKYLDSLHRSGKGVSAKNAFIQIGIDGISLLERTYYENNKQF